MYNTMNINPAYAGSRGTTSLFGLHRTQWVGLVGAPTTNTFAIHSPLRDSNLGMGLTIMNDVIGPSDESTVSIDFSYTIPTSDRFKLAFGFRATAHLLNIDFTKLNIFNPEMFWLSIILTIDFRQTLVLVCIGIQIARIWDYLFRIF